MNNFERQTDVIKIIEKVDISPSMYKNALDKYNHLANYLELHGLDAKIYPQGSFALGTVTRPYAYDKEKNYDLDFICQINATREDISPEELRKKVEEILTNSDLYGGRLNIDGACFTVEYADVGNIGFSIDIVPATDESNEKKSELSIRSKFPELIGTSIAIPRCDNYKLYNWITNNPKGYQAWFSSINKPFAEYSRDSFKKRLFESNRSIFCSVEEIPDELNRSSLQRVIQILKYHRDVYYSRVEDGNSIKPISAIINTTVAQLASYCNPQISVYELLAFVLDEFSVYEMQLKISEEDFAIQYSNRNLIHRYNGKWIIENPANPEDNLADKWNENRNIPRQFFRWASIAKSELIDSLESTDEDFRAITESAFGKKLVQNEWGTKYNAESPKSIPSEGYPKPWRVK